MHMYMRVKNIGFVLWNGYCSFPVRASTYSPSKKLNGSWFSCKTAGSEVKKAATT
jgi:hypothetical protein